MKKFISLGLAVVVLLCMVVSCSEAGSTDGASGYITVISREDGSGTRGAFVELFDIEEKDENGYKIDNTTLSAEITNSTAVMITNVEGNKNAIGYISLGSMNESITAVEIDGAAATVENIKNGTYKVSRPFNIVTKGGLSELGEDFISFILSDEGQAVVEEAGYISSESTGAYKGSVDGGKLTIGGSSSVTPVMEKLKEAYVQINPNVTIEVQQSDSTTGVTSVIDGAYDIGMISRELKDSENEQGVFSQVIATDGIAVIVNNNSGITGLTSEQVKSIFTGEVTKWSEVL